MAGVIEYPPILTNNAQQDNYNLREYIIRNINLLQQVLLNSGGSMQIDESSTTGDINITINANIEAQPNLQEKTVNVTENGDFSVEPDDNKDGLSKVNLHVTVPIDGPSGTLSISENGTYNVTDYASAEVDVEPDLQSKSVTITTNGSQTISPDTGKDGLSSVAITTNVPTTATLQSKSVTPTASAQTVSPDNGYDGLSQVTVAATPLESKSVTPAAADQTVTPSSGKVGLSQVVVAGAPLEQKSVTPGASQTNVTPSSGYYGLSKVVVAGDADLIAGNIKKDIVIFGVTGSYEGSGAPINGSLIEITCSSNITQVTATVNGNTYTAYLNTSTHKAYVTIPYTDTTAARTCTLRGYANGSQVTSSTVSMAKGIGYYTAQLSTSAWLFRNGTWTGVETHEWIRIAPSTYAGSITVTESNVLTMALSSAGGSTRYAWVYLSPKLNNRGFSQLEIVVDSKLTEDPIYVCCGSSTSSEHSIGTSLSVGTNLINLTADDFYLEFYMNDWQTRNPNCTAVISSMRFV